MECDSITNLCLDILRGKIKKLETQHLHLFNTIQISDINNYKELRHFAQLYIQYKFNKIRNYFKMDISCDGLNGITLSASFENLISQCSDLQKTKCLENKILNSGNNLRLYEQNKLLSNTIIHTDSSSKINPLTVIPIHNPNLPNNQVLIDISLWKILFLSNESPSTYLKIINKNNITYSLINGYHEDGEALLYVSSSFNSISDIITIQDCNLDTIKSISLLLLYDKSNDISSLNDNIVKDLLIEYLSELRILKLGHIIYILYDNNISLFYRIEKIITVNDININIGKISPISDDISIEVLFETKQDLINKFIEYFEYTHVSYDSELFNSTINNIL